MAFSDYEDALKSFIHYCDKLVTYKWLSKELEIHVNLAKYILKQYWDKYKIKENITATLLIIGQLKDGSIRVSVVRESDLDSVKKKFVKIDCEHMYSIQKSLLDIKLLALVDEGDLRYSAIKCNEAYIRSEDEIAAMRRIENVKREENKFLQASTSTNESVEKPVPEKVESSPTKESKKQNNKKDEAREKDGPKKQGNIKDNVMDKKKSEEKEKADPKSIQKKKKLPHDVSSNKNTGSTKKTPKKPIQSKEAGFNKLFGKFQNKPQAPPNKPDDSQVEKQKGFPDTAEKNERPSIKETHTRLVNKGEPNESKDQEKEKRETWEKNNRHSQSEEKTRGVTRTEGQSEEPRTKSEADARGKKRNHSQEKNTLSKPKRIVVVSGSSRNVSGQSDNEEEEPSCIRILDMKSPQGEKDGHLRNCKGTSNYTYNVDKTPNSPKTPPQENIKLTPEDVTSPVFGGKKCSERKVRGKLSSSVKLDLDGDNGGQSNGSGDVASFKANRPAISKIALNIHKEVPNCATRVSDGINNVEYKENKLLEEAINPDKDSNTSTQDFFFNVSFDSIDKLCCMVFEGEKTKPELNSNQRELNDQSSSENKQRSQSTDGFSRARGKNIPISEDKPLSPAKVDQEIEKEIPDENTLLELKQKKVQPTRLSPTLRRQTGTKYRLSDRLRLCRKIEEYSEDHQENSINKEKKSLYLQNHSELSDDTDLSSAKEPRAIEPVVDQTFEDSPGNVKAGNSSTMTSSNGSSTARGGNEQISVEKSSQHTKIRVHVDYNVAQRPSTVKAVVNQPRKGSTFKRPAIFNREIADIGFGTASSSFAHFADASSVSATARGGPENLNCGISESGGLGTASDGFATARGGGISISDVKEKEYLKFYNESNDVDEDSLLDIKTNKQSKFGSTKRPTDKAVLVFNRGQLVKPSVTAIQAPAGESSKDSFSTANKNGIVINSDNEKCYSGYLNELKEELPDDSFPMIGVLKRKLDDSSAKRTGRFSKFPAADEGVSATKLNKSDPHNDSSLRPLSTGHSVSQCFDPLSDSFLMKADLSNLINLMNDSKISPSKAKPQNKQHEEAVDMKRNANEFVLVDAEPKKNESTRAEKNVPVIEIGKRKHADTDSDAPPTSVKNRGLEVRFKVESCSPISPMTRSAMQRSEL